MLAELFVDGIDFGFLCVVGAGGGFDALLVGRNLALHLEGGDVHVMGVLQSSGFFVEDVLRGLPLLFECRILLVANLLGLDADSLTVDAAAVVVFQSACMDRDAFSRGDEAFVVEGFGFDGCRALALDAGFPIYRKIGRASCRERV